MGDSTRGAGAPLCVVVGGGFLRGRGSRNTLPLKRAFAYFSHEGKVSRGTGVKPPKLPGYGGGAPEKLTIRRAAYSAKNNFYSTPR